MRIRSLYVSLFFIYFLTNPFSIVEATETHCLVVSGLEKDRNEAFIDDTMLQKGSSSILGKPCHIFDSWTELKKYYDDHIKNTNPIENQVFIYQGAHGGRGGSVHCNRGKTSANEIVEILKDISAIHSAGAFLNSCSSGNTLEATLIEDEMNPRNLSKLCVITSSTFDADSREPSTYDAVAGVSPGESMEDLFLKMDEGLISSAAWDSVGVGAFLKKHYLRITDETLKMFQDTFVNGEGSRRDCSESVVKKCKSVAFADWDSDFSNSENNSEVNSLYQFADIFEFHSKANSQERAEAGEQFKKQYSELLGLGNEAFATLILSRSMNESFQSLSCENAELDPNYKNAHFESVVRDFMYKSLELDQYRSGIDQARRQACRNFVFDNPHWNSIPPVLREYFLAERLILRNGSLGDIQKIIERSPDLIKKSVVGNRPPLFWLAMRKKRYDLIKLFLELGARTETFYQNRPLLGQAVVQGDKKMVLSLLEHGANINQSSEHPAFPPPLFQAALIGNYELFELLIKRGAKLRWEDPHACTLLEAAFAGGNSRIIALAKNIAEFKKPRMN